jgi:hypothetical protein
METIGLKIERAVGGWAVYDLSTIPKLIGVSATVAALARLVKAWAEAQPKEEAKTS